MNEHIRPRTIAELPVQRAVDPGSDAQPRARYFNSGNAFMLELSQVPNAVFVDEPARALDPSAPTGLTACDVSVELQCPFPATSPLVLARYARIRAGESLVMDLAASGVLHYVIEGRGTTEGGGELVKWGPGDVFVTPGGISHNYTAGDEACVLWVVSNEPQLAFEHSQPPAPGQAPTEIVHYPAAEIARQIDLLYEVGGDKQISGTALIFSSDRQEAGRNILPTLTLGMNTLAPGVMQRPHRHNSVAVSLVVRGQGCYSMIDGERKDWAPWATTITPPTSVHSHHNDGAEQAMFLIVQDGGIFYHVRATGFEFVDA